jgi:hypothetical protein
MLTSYFAVHPFVHTLVVAVVTGVMGGATVDYHAFLQFHSWIDFAKFDWQTATFRWFQGGVAGVVGAFALFSVGA